jgi:uncharacterized membrane protein YqhA
MIDAVQLIVILSLISITIVIVVSSIHLINLFRQIKKLLVDIEPVVSDAKIISSSVAKPVSSISEFMMGFKDGLKIFNSIFPKKDTET